jgi:hypothetical protein
VPTITKRKNRGRSAPCVSRVRVRPFKSVSKVSATRDDAVRVGEPSVLQIAWVLKRAIDAPMTDAVEQADGTPR